MSGNKQEDIHPLQEGAVGPGFSAEHEVQMCLPGGEGPAVPFGGVVDQQSCQSWRKKLSVNLADHKSEF